MGIIPRPFLFIVMGFNCSIFLEDIDINCQKSNNGGIAKAYLGLQQNLSITFDPIIETKITSINLEDAVVFEHNKRDQTTVFTESKSTSNGLGIVTTDITIRLPKIDNKINKIDYMSRRADIVCIMVHNNGSVTVSGWMDGLTMNFDSTSGTSINDLSYVNVTLTTQSYIASLVADDSTALTFTNITTPTQPVWSVSTAIWSNNNIIWG